MENTGRDPYFRCESDGLEDRNLGFRVRKRLDSSHVSSFLTLKAVRKLSGAVRHPQEQLD